MKTNRSIDRFLVYSSILALCSFSTAAPTSTSSIKWSQCPQPFVTGVQCAQLKVPLDWAHPKGDQITLGLTRLQATNPDKRIGNLFYNPGGPGAVTSQYLNYQASGLPVFGAQLVQHFDIIGVDPRGIGLSSAIKCNPNQWNERVTAFPTNQDEFDKLVARNKAAWESCQNLTGPLLGHIDTTSVARDLEAVRVALGNTPLNWLGESYGTQLGVAYAELYPHNFRAMVLDGNLDHSQSEVTNLVTEGTTYETELERFFNWCSTTSDCLLHGQNVTNVFIKLVDQASKAPIPAPGCSDSGGCRSTVTGEDILFNAQGLLRFKDPNAASAGWNGLAAALQEAGAGNATLLSSPIATDETSTLFGGAAVLCLDWTHSAKTLSDIKQKNELASYFAPVTKGACQMYGVQTSCIGFPLPLANPEHTANVQNTKPILMTNAVYDPETSLVWAETLRAQIANVNLVVRNGDGHTSYNLGGETTAIIEAYLVNKTLPARNTVVDS